MSQFRKLFPPTKWSAEINAAITVPFFQWLVGPAQVAKLYVFFSNSFKVWLLSCSQSSIGPETAKYEGRECHFLKALKNSDFGREVSSTLDILWCLSVQVVSNFSEMAKRHSTMANRRLCINALIKLSRASYAIKNPPWYAVLYSRLLAKIKCLSFTTLKLACSETAWTLLKYHRM